MAASNTVLTSGTSSSVPSPREDFLEPKVLQGGIAYERKSLSLEEIDRAAGFLQKNRSTRGSSMGKFFGAPKKMTPAEQYERALRQGLHLAGDESGLSRVNAKATELENLGVKAGKSRAQIDKDKTTLYDFAYDTRKRTLLDKAKRGQEDAPFLKELTQMADWGVKAGKTLVEITDDKKKIYQEFFNWAFTEAHRLARHRVGGPDFHDRLADMDRYGLLGGFLPTDVAKMKQGVMEDFYRSALKDLKRHLLAVGCDHPDKEIVLSGSTLTVQGVNCSSILSYGAAAGHSPSDLAHDVDLLKSDIKTENHKRIQRDLLDGAQQLLDVQKKAIKGVLGVAYEAGREIGGGLRQIGQGAEKLVKELI